MSESLRKKLIRLPLAVCVAIGLVAAALWLYREEERAYQARILKHNEMLWKRTPRCCPDAGGADTNLDRRLTMTKLNIALFGIAAFIVGVNLNATPTVPVAANAPAAQKQGKPCYVLTDADGYGGLWVQHEGGPCAMLVSEKSRGAFFALEGGDVFKSGGFQFAISANNGEVYFQIRDSKGKFHFVPVEALLKLKEKK